MLRSRYGSAWRPRRRGKIVLAAAATVLVVAAVVAVIAAVSRPVPIRIRNLRIVKDIVS